MDLLVKQKNFTLIELLVVVAIIGILSSLLLPSISKARLKAQQAVCLSNQKQVALSALSYAVDFNGHMPSYTDDNNHWPDKIMDGYMTAAEGAQYSLVMKCPNGTKQSSTGKINVSMNSNLTGSEFGSAGKSIDKATGSETALLTDSYKWWKQVSHKTMKNEYLLDDINENNIARHLLKANVIYIDGHGVAKTASFLLTKSNSTDTFWDPEQ